MHIDSKIYVAGHTGLVGSSILRALKTHGYKNIITKEIQDLDLRSQSQVESFFQENRPEYVFLAAAKVGGIWANNAQKADFIYDNLMISANVISASHKFGVEKLLNLGSSCIYPKNAPQPLKEEYLLSGSLEPTNEAYAIAKISALKLCRYFNEQYGTNFISVMPTNLYGPNDNFNLETAHVLPAMIRKFHLAKLLAIKDFVSIRSDFKKFGLPLLKSGASVYAKSTTDGSAARPAVSAEATQSEGWEPVEGCELQKKYIEAFSDSDIQSLLAKFGITATTLNLWGTGAAYREFLHVDDLVLALLFLMNKYDFSDLGECINIGVGVDLKISELAQIIKNVVGFNGEIKFDCASSDGTPRKLLDVCKISKLGWKANITLEFGIRSVYEWYCTCLKEGVL
ncbi:MAG: GDP-L-fucose synthase [Candidatus Babeliales bacterium]|jgi:GDP-L-fucose synthase